LFLISYLNSIGNFFIVNNPLLIPKLVVKYDYAYIYFIYQLLKMKKPLLFKKFLIIATTAFLLNTAHAD